MANLGVRDDPDQEGWEKMGPLVADPTPANAKNRGVVERKKRRGEENTMGDEDGNATNAPAAIRADGSREGAATAEGSEMDEIRDAIAEAIQEIETEAVQRKIRGEGGEGQREAARESGLEGIGDPRRHTDQQRQQQEEHHQQQVHATPDVNTSRPTAVTVNSTACPTDQFTPMQLMQQRPREKFGTGILRTPEEKAMQEERMREENVGTSSLQEGNLAAATERPERV